MSNDSSGTWGARVWKDNALKQEAERQVSTITEALIPRGYQLSFEEGDYPVPNNEYAPHYKHMAKLTPDGDSPHWVVYGYTRGSLMARVLGEILANSPVYPIA